MRCANGRFAFPEKIFICTKNQSHSERAVALEVNCVCTVIAPAFQLEFFSRFLPARILTLPPDQELA